MAVQAPAERAAKRSAKDGRLQPRVGRQKALLAVVQTEHRTFSLIAIKHCLVGCPLAVSTNDLSPEGLRWCIALHHGDFPGCR